MPPESSDLRQPRTSRWRALVVLLLVVLLGCLAIPTARAQATGGIRGNIVDADYQVALPRVRVTVVGTTRTALTSDDGNFLIANVPSGTYTLSLTADGYERKIVPNVVVLPGRLADVSAELSLEVFEMDEMVVTGDEFATDSEVGQLEIRMAAVAMQDSISKELISKAGASDVAAALPLVVGASVVNGKYATVRGLSDRYTGTTMNGVRLPSADPRRRAVQVDLFPTGTVENVIVTKTFTPDLQGDFTGGGVDIETRGVPDGVSLQVGGSYEWDSIATGNDGFLTYNGAGVSVFSKDDSRRIPELADGRFPEFPEISLNPSPADMARAQAYDAITRSFQPTMGTSNKAPGLNSGLSLYAGNNFKVGSQGVLGVSGGLTYKNKYKLYRNATNNNAVISDPDQPITTVQERNDNKGAEEVTMGFLGNVSYLPNEDHDLSLILVENFVAEDTARIQSEDTGGGSVEQNQTLQYTERRLGSVQLHGKHLMRDLFGSGSFGNLAIDWSGSWNFTEQDQPDVRFFRNVFNYDTLTGEMPSNSTDAKNSRRIWRDLEEEGFQFQANVAAPFRQWSGYQGEIKTGLFVDRSAREYEQRSYTYTFANQVGSFFDQRVLCNGSIARFRTDSPDELWTDVFTDPGRIGLVQGLEPCDDPGGAPAPNQLLWVIIPLGDDVDYTGDQEIDAVYGMADLPITRKFRTIFGARYETTDLLMVPTNPLFGTVEVIQQLPSGDRAIVTVPEEEAIAEIEDGSWLPSIGLVYEAQPNMFVRASWNRTLARPTFRELAPVATEEFIFGDEYVGNPTLEMSAINNFDLRWEWFPKPGRVLAVSTFFKDLTDPIEVISFATGNRSFIQPLNFETGRVRGFEIEARTDLSMLGRGGRNWVVGANYTGIDSEVDVPLSEQESLESFGLDEPTRPLQGQPAFLLNLNVTFDDPRRGVSAGLFLNTIGETLVTGAARGTEDGTPNVFSEEYRSLDFTFTKQLGRQLRVGFKIKNLLQDDRVTFYRTPSGEEAVKTDRETSMRIALGFVWTL